ncbi:MAG: class I SAM-dependent methyltransferase [Pseudomonadota bacterium]|nr:class I SAM-dependent methyltransferase [Pseudomonadota bacterium]
MTAEVLFALRHQSPGKILRNVRAMKTARTPIRGFVTTACFWTLLDAGLMDTLEQESEIDIERVCDERGFDPTITEEVCRYLSRLGYLELDGHRVALTRKGKRFWDDTQGVMNIFFAYEEFFENLPQLLRREIVLSDIKRRDQNVAHGFRETGPRLTFDVLGKLIAPMGVDGVIELGCGNVDLSSFLARQNEDMRFLGIDRDQTFLEQARQTIREQRLDGRVELLEQDIFGLGDSRYDFAAYQLVTAVDLFHGYFFEGRQKLLELFATFKQTFAGKRFLISEVCLPDEDKMHRLSYPHVEHELFHALTGQKTFREGELEALFRDSGFSNVQTWSVRNLGARIFLQCDA